MARLLGFNIRAGIIAQIAFLCLWSSAAESKQTILIYGDSLSAGYGLTQSASFSGQLEKALQKRNLNVKLFNASQSGETSAGGLRRIVWTLDSLPKIDIAILELGANDALRAQPPERTKANLEKIIQALKKRHIKILLAGMIAPPNLGSTYGKKFNSLYKTLARKYKTDLYPFFLEGVAGDRTLNLQDGIHPNEAGVKLIVSKITPYVLKTLQRDKTRRENK